MAGSYVSPGSVENPTPGQFATAAWGDAVNTALNYFDTLVDDAAWISWTPQIDQGASVNIAKTIVYAKYKKIGRTVIAKVTLNLTAAGTAGAEVRVSIPFAAVASGDAPHCSGFFIDASVPQVYVGASYINASDKVVILRDSTGGNGVGVNPNVALASGDSFRFTIIYEATA